MKRTLGIMAIVLFVFFMLYSACKVEAREVTLEWDDPSSFGSGLDHYNLYWGTESESLNRLVPIPPSNQYVMIFNSDYDNVDIYFGMSTVDTSGLESLLSNIVLAVDDQVVIDPPPVDIPVVESAATELLTFQLTVTDESGATSTDMVNVTVMYVNMVSVANAGDDLTVLTGSEVSLDGSLSSDVDGDVMSYLWTIITLPDGSVAALANETSVNPTFTPDRDGVYTFQLIVNDGTVDSEPDVVDVISFTPNKVPVANAGGDMVVDENSAVLLDGSASSDPDGDSITFLWEQVQGTTVELVNADTMSATFVAPNI